MILVIDEQKIGKSLEVLQRVTRYSEHNTKTCLLKRDINAQ